jgi:Rps23 Pro-64 3,4-dihydroxylase Tpa1-like proline 4-hydroxylase
MYPHGTSLSVDAGKGAGYVYSLENTWKMHWGGLLLLADGDQELTKSIMPKKNRMVFIASGAYRMITRINEQSGDNVRRTLAGFFHRKT